MPNHPAATDEETPISNQLTTEELADRYEKLSPAVVYDVLDKMGFPNQALSSEIRPVDPKMKIAGPAFTIVGENQGDGSDYGSAAFEMFRHMSPGNVLVMGGMGHAVSGPWGENASLSAQLAGVRGMVTDTGTRDAGPIAELGFPTFSRYITPVFMSGRFAFRGHQAPIELAGQVDEKVTITPDDFIVADRDGIVVVPQALKEKVLLAAEELERVEKKIREALRTGEDREAVYRRYPKFAHIQKP